MLTTSEVAKLFRVSDKTVDSWRRDSLIPYFTTPKGWARYRRSELLPHLKSREARTPAGIE